jgi:hypothetical protein
MEPQNVLMDLAPQVLVLTLFQAQVVPLGNKNVGMEVVRVHALLHLPATLPIQQQTVILEQ